MSKHGIMTLSFSLMEDLGAYTFNKQGVECQIAPSSSEARISC